MSELQCKFKSALTIGPQLLESTARAPQPLQRRLHGGRTCCVRVARRPGKVNYNSWQLLGNADLLFTRKIHHATFTSLLPASDCEGSLGTLGSLGFMQCHIMFGSSLVIKITQILFCALQVKWSPQNIQNWWLRSHQLRWWPTFFTIVTGNVYLSLTRLRSETYQTVQGSENL